MSIIDYVGNTPLLRLRKESSDMADIYVKLEHLNPGGSIKTRVAAKMVELAEKEGVLKRGNIIIEATGGNTGVGLAIISNVKGYKFTAVVPDNYSKERIKLLKIYGATVILSDSSKGNDSHIRLVEEMVQKNKKYIWLNQFENKASIEAHFEGTAKEIVEQVMPDAFIASVGSAGTFQGVANYLLKVNPEVKLYVAQPKGCNLQNGTAVKHRVQGVSLGIIPPMLNYSTINGYIDIDFEETKKTLKKMVEKEGLLLGISSGQNIAAAYRVAKKLGNGKVVCTVAPDTGSYYLNEGVFGIYDN